MKQLTAVLLCLLLLGCSSQVPEIPPETVPETRTAPTSNGMYEPGHPMEQAYPGQVRAYPLTLRKVHGVRAMGNDVLILSGQGNTTLTLLTGEKLEEKASVTLEFQLEQEDPSLQIHEEGISFFSPVTRETVVLDDLLQEVRRIAVPEEISGKPMLSSDGRILYYCTGWSVMAWELDSGIRRTVKEMVYDAQELTALHGDGQILECRIQDGTSAYKLLLSVDQGLEIRTLPENTVLYTDGHGYFTVFPSGYQTLLIHSTMAGNPELLLPSEMGQAQFYLPEDHAAVTVISAEEGIRLDYYELNTGILRSSITLDPLQNPKNIVNSKNHALYILAYDPAADCGVLYRWDVLRQTPDPANVTTYQTDYRSAEDPDLEGLETCRKQAEAIGEKYGVTVLVWEDVLTVQPWDYQFKAEYLAPVLEKELQLLDTRLAQYPQEVLQQTKEHFSGLTFCLVRQITGTGAGNSLTSATGIQFFQDGEAYVAVTTGKYSEQALYHELPWTGGRI